MMQGFLPCVKYWVVRLMCDNSMAVSNISKEGATKSFKLTQLVIQIPQLCDWKGTQLVPVHLRGSCNIQANALSRKRLMSELSWRMSVPQLMRWGRFQPHGHMPIKSELRTTSAAAFGGSTEVFWRLYLRDMTSSLDNMAIVGFVVMAQKVVVPHHDNSITSHLRFLHVWVTSNCQLFIKKISLFPFGTFMKNKDQRSWSSHSSFLLKCCCSTARTDVCEDYTGAGCVYFRDKCQISHRH